MAEREADRARPDLLRQQAVAALLADAGREISSDFLRRLREHEVAPSFFGASEFAAMASTGLEAEVVRSVGLGQVGAKDALSEALRRRGDGYAREQNCQLVAARHPSTTNASESVKKAFNDAAPIAAALILTGQSAPKSPVRIQLSENLLAPPSGGVGP